MQSLVRLFAGLTQRTASFLIDDSTQRTASFELSKKISAWAGFWKPINILVLTQYVLRGQWRTLLPLDECVFEYVVS